MSHHPAPFVRLRRYFGRHTVYSREIDGEFPDFKWKSYMITRSRKVTGNPSPLMLKSQSKELLQPHPSLARWFSVLAVKPEPEDVQFYFRFPTVTPFLEL